MGFERFCTAAAVTTPAIVLQAGYACGFSIGLGQPLVAPQQRDGVKWTVVNKDVPLALLEIARRERVAGDYLRSLVGARVDGLYSLRDPLPGLLNARAVAKQIVSRRPRALWRGDFRALSRDIGDLAEVAHSSSAAAQRSALNVSYDA